MANLSTVLKSEIQRLARKQVRESVDPLRRQLAAQRRDISALKRERDTLRRQLASLAKSVARDGGPARAEPAEDEGPQLRFSAPRLKALRDRLGLSATQFGQLVGTSGQTVYNWELGKVRPRRAALERIAALRQMGKREVRRRLESDAE